MTKNTRRQPNSGPTEGDLVIRLISGQEIDASLTIKEVEPASVREAPKKSTTLSFLNRTQILADSLIRYLRKKCATHSCQDPSTLESGIKNKTHSVENAVSGRLSLNIHRLHAISDKVLRT